MTMLISVKYLLPVQKIMKLANFASFTVKNEIAEFGHHTIVHAVIYTEFRKKCSKYSTVQSVLTFYYTNLFHSHCGHRIACACLFVFGCTCT